MNIEPKSISIAGLSFMGVEPHCAKLISYQIIITLVSLRRLLKAELS